MSGFQRYALKTLVAENSRSKLAGGEVWNLNLDQIEPDTGRVLAKQMVSVDKLGTSTYPFEAGTVLYSKLRPYLNKVVVADAPGVATTELVPLRCNPERLLPKYLAYFLRSAEFLQFANIVVAGAKMPRMVMGEFWNYKIPVPPLSEQHRIAAILDQADALRAKRREALAQLDSLTQSIFIEMFGDPVENPNGWKLYPLQKVCSAINDCPHTTPKWTTEGIICLRTSNLTKGGWLWKDTRYVTVDAYHERSKRGYLKTGDIVLSREGTVGIAAIVPDGLQVCMGQRLVQVRPDNVNVNSDYLLYHLLYVLAPSRLSKLMVGSTTHHLNVKELRDLKVPVPPLNVQREFSQRIAKSNDIITANRNSSTQLQKLFDNLQHLAFRGEL